MGHRCAVVAVVVGSGPQSPADRRAAILPQTGAMGSAGRALTAPLVRRANRCQGYPLTTGRVDPYASRQFTTKSPIRIR